MIHSIHCVQFFFHFSVAVALAASPRELYLIEFLAMRFRNLKSAFLGCKSTEKVLIYAYGIYIYMVYMCITYK